MDFATNRIATQRIKALFFSARENIKNNPDLAQRYVDIARKVAMAARVRLPKKFRRQVCRKCKSFILPGINCQIRIKPKRESHIVITCFKCGKHTRIPLKRKKIK